MVSALYATVPCRFYLDGQVVLAAQSLDTMVDAKSRGLGLFTKLAKVVNENMQKAGVAFVYGFPNGNSHSGFVKNLNWSMHDPVPFLFRPINLSFAASKLNHQLGRFVFGRIPALGKKNASKLLSSLPEREPVDQLWNEFSSQIEIGRVRDHAFLHKRYVMHPKSKYFYRACFEGHFITGLLIYCIEEKHGGRIGYIMELMCLPTHKHVASLLITDAVADMHTQSCDGVLVWCFGHSPYFRHYIKQFFLPLPERARPIELHFGYRDFESNGMPRLQSRTSWYLSYSDSDTV